ncbi:uncharacterized protein LOC105691523 isoform X2 [Athalia rosae]|uniref:uncharacterized protein LOC105691523 isoform X2 n=1 Tax=Athalia rosae TaxID=37344 RepID=UPI0020332FF3|nr:uncharacterized protein LOC105691523 isoform X2 [Athalia rosae]
MHRYKMKDVDDSLNTSVLSKSYRQGMRRLAGDSNRDEDTFQISRKIIENREKSWSILFDKFSEISDDLELNLQTLRPDTLSEQSDKSETDISEFRVPIRKSMAQLQHWVNTGKAPCQLTEVEESYIDDVVSSLHRSISIESSDSKETVSISESELSDPNLLDPHSSFAMNPLKKVNNRQDSFDGSSDSSVDTTTYIKRNTSVTKKTVNLSNNGRVIQSGHSRKSELSCENLLQSPWSGVVSKDLSYGTVSIGKNIVRGIGDKNEELHSLIDKSVSRNMSSPDNNISCNDVEAVGKRLQSTVHENSDVEFQSQNSDISLPTKSTKDRDNLEQSNTTADPLNDASVLAENCLQGRRKLYTKDTCLTDIKFSKFHTKSRRSRSIQIKHPALLTPVSVKRSKFKPRLLTTQRCPRGKKSRNFSLNLNVTKPVLSGKKSLEDSVKLPKKVKISEMPRGCSNQCVVAEAGNIREMTNVDAQLDQVDSKSTTSPGGQKIGTSISSPLIDSNGVSSIIDDKILEDPKNQVTVIPVNKLPNQSARLDISMLGDKELSNDCRNFLSSDHQVSICESLPNSSCTLTRAKLQNIIHAKRNLCKTDLQSSDNKSDASDNSGLSITPQPNFESHNTSKTLNRSSRADYSINSVQLSAQFQPIVVLHDFLHLKSCCGELERKNNKQWLNRQGDAENSNPNTLDSDQLAQQRESSSEHSVSKENIILQSPNTLDSDQLAQQRESSSEHSVSRENIILQSPHIQTSVEKILKMDDKLNPQKNRAEVIITKCKIKNDNKKKEMTSLCEITSVENAKNTVLGSTSDTISPISPRTLKPSFTAGINHTQKKEPPIKRHTSSVTFADASCNWESIFVPTSSDEDDAVIKLNKTWKKRVSRRKEAGIQQTNSARLTATKHLKDSTLQPASMLQSSMSVKKSFSIVSSCSEDENNIKDRADMIPRSTRLQRKYLEKTKRRDILKSRLTICSPIDERIDKSERMIVNNGILESPSTGIITRLRRKKSKKSMELSTASFPSAQSEVDAETHSYTEPRIGVMQIPNDSEVGVCSKPNRTELCESNHSVTENEVLKTPVHRTLEYSPNKSDDTSRINPRLEDATCSGLKIILPRCRSPKNLLDKSGTSSESEQTKPPLKISRARARISSTSTDETERKQEEKNGLVVRRVPDYKYKRKQKFESMTVRKHISLIDKSSDDDDAAFPSNSKDYTCTVSLGENVSRPNEKRNVTAISDASKSFPKKHRRKTRTNSTVVFRTKEYWESDSDNM